MSALETQETHGGKRVSDRADHVYVKNSSPFKRGEKRDFSTFMSDGNYQPTDAFMPPSPKRSMDTFKESQLHGNDRNHFIQNGGSAPQSNLADSSAAAAAKPEISGDSTPNVLNTDELFRMAPDMVPLQQKAEELMYSSQVLMNDHFNKASILMQESYNAVVNASVARQQVIMNLVEAIFAQRSENIASERYLMDLRKKTEVLSSEILGQK